MMEHKHTALLREAQRRGQKDIDALRLCFQLLGVAAAIDRDCAARLAPHGVSEARFLVLFLLHGADAPLSPHHLAEQAGVSRPTMTGLLDGLERDCLIERKADAHDGRRWHIVLSRRGHALARRLFDQHTLWIEGLMTGLDAQERKHLSMLLSKVWQQTDAGRGDVV